MYAALRHRFFLKKPRVSRSAVAILLLCCEVVLCVWESQPRHDRAQAWLAYFRHAQVLQKMFSAGNETFCTGLLRSAKNL